MPAPYGSRYVSLAPFSLYASPGWERELDRGTLQQIVRFLTGPRTRGFVWTVRFDHTALASGLASFGIASRTAPTHVISLDGGYADAAARYSATIRNQIGKARRRGVEVRAASSESDVRAYYDLHTRLVEQKEWKGYRHPLVLFLELNRLRDCMRLLVAEHEGRMVAGAVFLQDACSVMYWHGASDREYSNLFATRPLFDEAIRWACETKARFVDLGGSAGIASLEQFKASWGARPEVNHVFEWSNPLWTGLAALKCAFQRERRAAPPADRRCRAGRDGRWT
jgi:hypothetical protein